MRLVFCFTACLFAGLLTALPVRADMAPSVPRAALMGLAERFVERVGSGLEEAEQQNNFTALAPAQDIFVRDGVADSVQEPVMADQVRGIPEGEPLIFNVRLTRRLQMDEPVFGMVRDRQVVLALRDFMNVLDLPVNVNAAAGTARGWYIREQNIFDLNLEAGRIETAQGVFTPSDSVIVQDGDIFVPAQELAQWLDFTLDIDIGALVMFVETSQPLPLLERRQRRDREFRRHHLPPPSLPEMDPEWPMAGVPMVDVATRSNYRRSGQTGDRNTRHDANIQTRGALAGGTLATQTRLNNRDRLASFRANYRQDSPDPDLLGPLQARRYEIGDIVVPSMPLVSTPGQELGARVTNADPLRSYIRPTTEITGFSQPGWDVELRRNNIVYDMQTTDESGIYLFEDVALDATDNVFQVVMYGPQGEVREEEVSIPVDTRLIAEGAGTYDVAVSLNRTQTYNKNTFDHEDKGTPNLVAYYEMPVGERSALTAGLTSGQQDGAQRTVAHGGLSTTLAGTLFNTNLAVDDGGEMAAELVARRRFGDHQFRNRLFWATDGYEVFTEDGTRRVFEEDARLSGPLPDILGDRTRYNVGASYTHNSDDSNVFRGSLGLSTMINRISLAQQFDYLKASNRDDDVIRGTSNASGRVGRNRVRLTAGYEIEPETKLDTVTASLNRHLTPDLSADLQLTRRVESGLTEGTGRLNWRTGHINLSPSLSYNTEGDLRGFLNTRFGLAYEPHSGGIKMFDRAIGRSGGLSAFVFLDKNGSGTFDEGDEPLEGVIVRAPHGGGRAVTDENGIAFFYRMTDMRLTDVFIQPDSLQDPFWIPAYEGVSFRPRAGHIGEVTFPVHMAGEMDGMIYARSPDGAQTALRGVRIHLHKPGGQRVATTAAGFDGFYLFETIPPGQYYVVIDENDARQQNFIRPPPEMIEIGYDGTIIYGHDLYMESGPGDVPLALAPDLEEYLALHRIAPGEAQQNRVILNLGDYNSYLMMALVWHKLQSHYPHILQGTELIVTPERSYASIKTGKHTLRVWLSRPDMATGWNICRALIVRGHECSVEFQGLPPQNAAQRIAEGR